ncbi:MAG: hypothetical protein RLZZ303_2930 [Candidatus Hydrogenedentota bacterium]
MAPPERRPKRARWHAGLLATLVVCAAPAFATEYFISHSQGSDSHPGTSADQPWRTFNRLLGVTLQPGDKVSLRRGDTWRETLIVKGSGTPGNPIRYGGYGVGPPPVIDGTDDYNAISALGGGKYRVITGAPVEVFVNGGTSGRRVAAEAALASPGDCFYADGSVTFLASSAPASVACATRQFGIVMNEVRDIRFTGITVRHAWDPVWAYNTERVTFELLRIDHGAGFAGIFLAANVPGFGADNVVSECIITSMRGSSGSLSFGNNGVGVFVFGQGLSRGNRIASTLVTDAGHEGIAVLDGSDHLITGNSVSGSASSGIRIAGKQSSGNVVERNEVFGNCHGQDDRFGIDLLDTGNDNVVRYNYVHEQEEVPGGAFKSGGIRFDGGDFTISENQTSTGNTGYYNVVYDEYVGINCFNVSNVVLFNNTVIDCTGFAIAIHAVSTEVPENNIAINNVVRMQTEVLFYENAVSGSIIDHNTFERHGNAYYFSGGFHDFESWRAARGFDLNGREGLLQFRDSAARDFRLTPESIAVDAGTSTAAAADFAGLPVPQGGAIDAGAYELVPPAPIEGEADGESDGEGASDGETVEGEGEPATPFHAADVNEDGELSLSEALRVVQLFTLGEIRCAPGSEDGYGAGNAPRDCLPHSADYNPQDWRISFLELLRVMQLFNAGGYTAAESSEDGFLPLGG